MSMEHRAEVHKEVIGKYELGKVLAGGDFDCRIRLCTHVITRGRYVIRIYSKMVLQEAPWMWRRVKEAIHVQRTLPRHKNTIEMVECFETLSSVYIVMQLFHSINIADLFAIFSLQNAQHMNGAQSNGQVDKLVTLNTNANDILASTLTMNGGINQRHHNRITTNQDNHTIGNDKVEKVDVMYNHNFSSFLRPSSTSFNSLPPSAPTPRITSSSTASSSYSSSPNLVQNNITNINTNSKTTLMHDHERNTVHSDRFVNSPQGSSSYTPSLACETVRPDSSDALTSTMNTTLRQIANNDTYLSLLVAQLQEHHSKMEHGYLTAKLPHALLPQPTSSLELLLPNQRPEHEQEKQEEREEEEELSIQGEEKEETMLMKSLELLQSQLKRPSHPFAIRSYFVQMVHAVLHLHEHSVVHLGIAPDHVLVNNRGEVKLSNLISCTRWPRGEKLREIRGTVQTVPPEVLRTGVYDPYLADAWALGVVLYYMLHNGTYPHDSANTLNKINHNRIRLPNPALPADARDLLSRLLQVDPAERLPVEGILFHPYYTAYFSEMQTNNSSSKNNKKDADKSMSLNNNNNSSSSLTVHHERYGYNSLHPPTSDSSDKSSSNSGSHVNLNASVKTKEGRSVELEHTTFNASNTLSESSTSSYSNSHMSSSPHVSGSISQSKINDSYTLKRKKANNTHNNAFSAISDEELHYFASRPWCNTTHERLPIIDVNSEWDKLMLQSYNNEEYAAVIVQRVFRNYMFLRRYRSATYRLCSAALEYTNNLALNEPVITSTTVNTIENNSASALDRSNKKERKSKDVKAEVGYHNMNSNTNNIATSTTNDVLLADKMEYLERKLNKPITSPHSTNKFCMVNRNSLVGKTTPSNTNNTNVPLHRSSASLKRLSASSIAEWNNMMNTSNSTMMNMKAKINHKLEPLSATQTNGVENNRHSTLTPLQSALQHSAEMVKSHNDRGKDVLQDEDVTWGTRNYLNGLGKVTLSSLPANVNEMAGELVLNTREACPLCHRPPATTRKVNMKPYLDTSFEYKKGEFVHTV